MKEAVDFDDLFADAINRQKRKAWKYKLARARLAAWAATAGKLGESAHAFVDSERRAASGFRSIMLLGVVAKCL